MKTNRDSLFAVLVVVRRHHFDRHCNERREKFKKGANSLPTWDLVVYNGARHQRIEITSCHVSRPAEIFRKYWLRSGDYVGFSGPLFAVALGYSSEQPPYPFAVLSFFVLFDVGHMKPPRTA